MKIRKILIISIIAVILSAYNAYAEILTADLDTETVTVGKEIVLTVNVNSESISGIQFDIKYDTNVLEYISLNQSEVFDESYISGINADNPGNISILLVFSEKYDFNGELLNLTFKALGTTGGKKIDLSQIKLMVNDERIVEENFAIEFKTKGRAQSSSSGRGGAISSVIDSKVDKTEENLKEEEEKRENETEEEKTSDEQQQKEPEVLEPVEIITFSDIDGHWAYDSIIFMANEGIVKGVGDNTFLPDRNITRAEFASLVSDTLYLEETMENIYTDVSDEDWYANVVLKCTKAGLITGYDGKFRPKDLITREEMAVIIFRMLNYIEILEQTEKTLVFQDENEISDWAKEGVTSVVNMGIMNGISENIFGAKKLATRAQGVKVLEKILKIQWNNI